MNALIAPFLERSFDSIIERHCAWECRLTCYYTTRQPASVVYWEAYGIGISTVERRVIHDGRDDHRRVSGMRFSAMPFPTVPKFFLVVYWEREQNDCNRPMDKSDVLCRLRDVCKLAHFFLSTEKSYRA